MHNCPLERRYGSKVEAVVRLILQLRASDASSKAIIFSQYPAMLGLIAAALTRNDVQHASLSRALSPFPPCPCARLTRCVAP